MYICFLFSFRVKAPTRKEPSLEVSEFHLSKVDKKNDRVKVTDLAKVLNKRAVHAEISHKLKTAHKTLKTLPKPLEQSDADRVSVLLRWKFCFFFMVSHDYSRVLLV